MAEPVVHFEIVGTDPVKLREYYGELFGWQYDTDVPVAPSASEAGNYGFITPDSNNAIPGIAGGVGGGVGYRPHTVFYVKVPNVEEALRKAESLGGARVVGPEQSPGTNLVVGQFTDLEGNLVGLAQIG